MVTAMVRDERKAKARSMLIRGVRCASIARHLGISYQTAHKWLVSDDDGWTNDIGVGRIATHSQAKCARMLASMGLSQSAIGDYLGHTQAYISRLLKIKPTAGQPEVYLRITGHVRDRNHNPLSKDVIHRCVPYTDDLAIVINLGDRGTSHTVPYARLVDNVDIIFPSDYEQEGVCDE